MSVSQSKPDPRPVGTSESQTGQQFLNPADRLMLAAHDGLLLTGHCGFLCQTHLWLNRRIDIDALRAALNRLNRTYPVMTARLVAPGWFRRPFWKFQPHATVQIHESALDGATHQDVWRYAEALCAEPIDLTATDPISWHLLHLPDSRDVLVMLFSHALMDGKAPEHVLKALNGHWNAPCESTGVPTLHASSKDDELSNYLKREPRSKRIRAVLHRLGQESRMLKPAALPISRKKRGWTMKPFRILVREMSTEQTAKATARVKRLCGFANLAPAVVAAAFRAIHALGPADENRGRMFKTDVPLNLRLPGKSEPIFRNFMTFIRLAASAGELDDGDALVRTLNGRMREDLRKGGDLGALQLMVTMAPHANAMKRHLTRTLKKGPLSLGFGFLGPVVAGLEKLGDVDIDWMYTMNATLGPPGITLQAHQFAGRLNLVLTYIGAAVSDELADALLTHTIRELTTDPA